MSKCRHLSTGVQVQVFKHRCLSTGVQVQVFHQIYRCMYSGMCVQVQVCSHVNSGAGVQAQASRYMCPDTLSTHAPAVNHLHSGTWHLLPAEQSPSILSRILLGRFFFVVVIELGSSLRLPRDAPESLPVGKLHRCLMGSKSQDTSIFEFPQTLLRGF